MKIKRNIIFFILLLIVIIISYFPALQSGFIWDDDDYITNNKTLNSIEGLKQIWFEFGATPQYYPLVFTGFWIEYHLWGINPFGYHFINVLLHVLNAFLIYLVLKKFDIPFSHFISLLFALHPVCVESVAWITERKNVLSYFFYLSAFLSYLKFIDLQEQTRNRSLKDNKNIINQTKALKFYILCFAFYIAALLSKTVSSSLPAVLILITLWKNKKFSIKDIIILIPFFIFGAAFGIITIWMEKHNVGAVGHAWSLNFAERFILAGRVIIFYISKIIFPFNLMFIYPRWDINYKEIIQYIFPITVILIFTVTLVFRKIIGFSLSIIFACFCITLFPALGFFDVYPMRYSFVADHFQYHAIIYIIIFISVSMIFIIEKMFKNLKTFKIIISLFFISSCLLFAFLTYRQCFIYKDIETLWVETLKKNPKAGIAHNNLANIMVKKNKNSEAIPHYYEAIKTMSYDETLYYNLANALFNTGKYFESFPYYEKAISINPDFAEAHNNYGNSLVKVNKIQEAEEHFKKSLELKPDFPNPYFKIGDIMLQKGNTKSALDYYRKAYRIDPNWSDVANNLAWILATNKKYQNIDEAVAIAKKAFKDSDGNDPSVLDTLAAAYAASGNFENAIKYAEKAYSIALKMNDKTNASEILKRIELYKTNRTYTE